MATAPEVEGDFDFYLRFVKPLVLNLNEPNDRALAAAWVQKLRDENAGTAELRTDYLKLLLFVLQRKQLIGVFSENPNQYETLEKFPETNLHDVARELLEAEEDNRRRQQDVGGAAGDFPPYSTEHSADLLEYSAAQDIPNFGVHAYYAVSNEPLPKWERTEKAVFPRGVVSTTERNIRTDVLSRTSSATSEPALDETGSRDRKSKTRKKPRSTSKSRKDKALTSDEEEKGEEKSEEKVHARFDEEKIPPKRKSLAEDESPSPLLGSVTKEQITRESPTWGSNLIGVSEPPVRETTTDAEISEKESRTSESSYPSLPYRTPSPRISERKVPFEIPENPYWHRLLPEGTADPFFLETPPSFLEDASLTEISPVRLPSPSQRQQIYADLEAFDRLLTKYESPERIPAAPVEPPPSKKTVQTKKGAKKPVSETRGTKVQQPPKIPSTRPGSATGKAGAKTPCPKTCPSKTPRTSVASAKRVPKATAPLKSSRAPLSKSKGPPTRGSEMTLPKGSRITLPGGSQVSVPGGSKVSIPERTEIRIPPPGTSGIRPPGISRIPPPGTSGIPPPGTSTIRLPGISRIPAPGTSGIRPPGTSRIRAPGTSGIRPPGTSRIPPPGTSGIRPPGISRIPAPGTSGIRPPGTSGIRPPSASGIRPPGVSRIQAPKTSTPQRTQVPPPQARYSPPFPEGSVEPFFLESPPGLMYDSTPPSLSFELEDPSLPIQTPSPRRVCPGRSVDMAELSAASVPYRTPSPRRPCPSREMDLADLSAPSLPYRTPSPRPCLGREMDLADLSASSLPYRTPSPRRPCAAPPQYDPNELKALGLEPGDLDEAVFDLKEIEDMKISDISSASNIEYDDRPEYNLNDTDIDRELDEWDKMIAELEAEHAEDIALYGSPSQPSKKKSVKMLSVTPVTSAREEQPAEISAASLPYRTPSPSRPYPGREIDMADLSAPSLPYRTPSPKRPPPCPAGPAISTSRIPAAGASRLQPPRPSRIPAPGTSGIRPPGISRIPAPGTSSIRPPGTSGIRPPGTSRIPPPGASRIRPPGFSGLRPPGTSGIRPPSASGIRPPGISRVQAPKTSTPQRTQVPPPEALYSPPFPEGFVEPFFLESPPGLMYDSTPPSLSFELEDPSLPIQTPSPRRVCPGRSVDMADISAASVPYRTPSPRPCPSREVDLADLPAPSLPYRTPSPRPCPGREIDLVNLSAPSLPYRTPSLRRPCAAPPQYDPNELKALGLEPGDLDEAVFDLKEIEDMKISDISSASNIEYDDRPEYNLNDTDIDRELDEWDKMIAELEAEHAEDIALYGSPSPPSRKKGVKMLSVTPVAGAGEAEPADISAASLPYRTPSPTRPYPGREMDMADLSAPSLPYRTPSPRRPPPCSAGPATSTSRIPASGKSRIQPPRPSGIRPPGTSRIPPPGTSGIRPPGISRIPAPGTSGIRLPSAAGIQPPQVSRIEVPKISTPQRTQEPPPEVPYSPPLLEGSIDPFFLESPPSFMYDSTPPSLDFELEDPSLPIQTPTPKKPCPGSQQHPCPGSPVKVSKQLDFDLDELKELGLDPEDLKDDIFDLAEIDNMNLSDISVGDISYHLAPEFDVDDTDINRDLEEWDKRIAELEAEHAEDIALYGESSPKLETSKSPQRPSPLVASGSPAAQDSVDAFNKYPWLIRTTFSKLAKSFDEFGTAIPTEEELQAAEEAARQLKLNRLREEYHKRYKHRRPDMPRSPPMFSRFGAVMEDQDREYDAAEFGEIGDADWQPAAQFLEDKTTLSPRAPSGWRSTAVHSDLLRQPDDEQFFADESEPELIDVDAEFEKSPASVRSPSASKEDVEKKIVEAEKDLSLRKDTTPAEGGLPVTTPRSSPLPIRPNKSIRVETDQGEVSFELPSFEGPGYKDPDRLYFESPPHEYYESPGSPLTPNEIEDFAAKSFGLPTRTRLSPVKPLDLPDFRAEQQMRKIQAIAEQQLRELQYSPPVSAPVTPKHQTPRRSPSPRQDDTLNTSITKHLPSPIASPAVVPGWTTPPRLQGPKKTPRPAIVQELIENARVRPVPDDILGQEMPPWELAENVRPVPEDIFGQEMPPWEMVYSSPPPLSPSDVRPPRAPSPCAALPCAVSPAAASPRAPSPRTETPVRSQAALTQPISPASLFFQFPPEGDDIFGIELPPEELFQSPTIPITPPRSPEPPISPVESPTALHLRLYQGEEPRYFSKEEMLISQGKTYSKKRLMKRRSSPPGLHPLREVADDYAEENVPFLAQVEKAEYFPYTKSKRIEFAEPGVETVYESPIKVPGHTREIHLENVRRHVQEITEQYEDLPEMDEPITEASLMPPPVKPPTVIPGWISPPCMKVRKMPRIPPPLLPEPTENVRVTPPARNIIAQEMPPDEMLLSPPPLSPGEYPAPRPVITQSSPPAASLRAVSPRAVSPRAASPHAVSPGVASPRAASPQAAVPYPISPASLFFQFPPEEDDIFGMETPQELFEGPSSPITSPPRLITPPRQVVPRRIRSPESPLSPPESPIDFHIRLYQADEPPYYSQEEMEIPQGTARIRPLLLKRKSAAPSLHRLHEVADDYAEEHVPFLAQVEAAKDKLFTKSKRIKVAKPRVETVHESPLKAPEYTTAHHIAGLRSFMQEITERHPPPSEHPEDLIGDVASVHWEASQSMLDESVPYNLPSPIRLPTVIPGWSTPPHLTELRTPYQFTSIPIKNVLFEEIPPFEMGYSPPPLAESTPFHGPTTRVPIDAAAAIRKSASPLTARTPTSPELPFSTRDEYLPQQHAITQPSPRAASSRAASPRAASPVHTLPTIFDTAPAADMFEDEAPPEELFRSPDRPITPPRPVRSPKSPRAAVPRAASPRVASSQSAVHHPISPDSRFFQLATEEDAIFGMEPPQELFEGPSSPITSPPRLITPPRRVVPRRIRSPESPLSPPESPIDFHIRLYQADEPPYYSQEEMEIPQGTARIRPMLLKRKSAAPSLHRLHEVADDYAEEHVPFLAQVEAAKDKLFTKSKRIKVAKPRVETVHESPLKVPEYTTAHHIAGLRSFMQEITERHPPPSEHPEDLIGAEASVNWEASQSMLDESVPYNLPPPLRLPTVVPGWSSPPRLTEIRTPYESYYEFKSIPIKKALFEEMPPFEMGYSPPPLAESTPFHGPITNIPIDAAAIRKSASPPTTTTPTSPELPFRTFEDLFQQESQFLAVEMPPEELFKEVGSPDSLEKSMRYGVTPFSPDGEEWSPYQQKILSSQEIQEIMQQADLQYSQLNEPEVPAAGPCPGSPAVPCGSPATPRRSPAAPCGSPAAPRGTPPQTEDPNASLEDFEALEKAMMAEFPGEPKSVKRTPPPRAVIEQMIATGGLVNKQTAELLRSPTWLERMCAMYNIHDSDLPKTRPYSPKPIQLSPEYSPKLPEVKQFADQIEEEWVPPGVWGYKSPKSPEPSPEPPPRRTPPPSPRTPVQQTPEQRTPEQRTPEQRTPEQQRRLFNMVEADANFLDEMMLPEMPESPRTPPSPTTPPTPPRIDDFFVPHTPTSPGTPSDLAEKIKKHVYSDRYYDVDRSLMTKYLRIKNKLVKVSGPTIPHVSPITEDYGDVSSPHVPLAGNLEPIQLFASEEQDSDIEKTRDFLEPIQLFASEEQDSDIEETQDIPPADPGFIISPPRTPRPRKYVRDIFEDSAEPGILESSPPGGYAFSPPPLSPMSTYLQRASPRSPPISPRSPPISPRIPPVSPRSPPISPSFNRSVMEHEYTEQFFDPERPKRQNYVISKNKMLVLKRHQSPPRLENIEEHEERTPSPPCGRGAPCQGSPDYRLPTPHFYGSPGRQHIRTPKGHTEDLWEETYERVPFAGQSSPEVMDTSLIADLDESYIEEDMSSFKWMG